MNKNIVFLLIFILLPASFSHSQTSVKNGSTQSISAKPGAQTIKSSPAYAELLLRKTERAAELEELLLDYTEEFPRVKQIRFELNLIQKEMDKVSAVNVAEAGKLSLALGKLLVRKIELEVDLWNLKIQYNDDQADVKRAKRKIEIYDKAVKEILP